MSAMTINATDQAAMNERGTTMSRTDKGDVPGATWV
jgi:hypothetical protein